MEALKHSHTLLVTFFLLSLAYKYLLLMLGKYEMLNAVRKKFLIPDMLIAIVFLALGIYMLVQIGMGNIGGWFHLKLTAVIIVIPCAIIGFKKQNKILASIGFWGFVYIYLLAFMKNPTLI